MYSLICRSHVVIAFGFRVNLLDNMIGLRQIRDVVCSTLTWTWTSITTLRVANYKANATPCESTSVAFASRAPQARLAGPVGK